MYGNDADHAAPRQRRRRCRISAAIKVDYYALRLPGQQVRGAADRARTCCTARSRSSRTTRSASSASAARRSAATTRATTAWARWPAPGAARRARPTASRARPAAASSTTRTCRRFEKVLVGARRLHRAARRGQVAHVHRQCRGTALMTTTVRHRRPPPHPRRGSRQHRRQRDRRHDREVRVAGARGAALLRGDGPRAPLLRGGAHHQPHLRHLLGRPHAGVASRPPRTRSASRSPTQTLEAPRAAQARRELRLPRAARLLPGRAGPARAPRPCSRSSRRTARSWPAPCG